METMQKKEKASKPSNKPPIEPFSIEEMEKKIKIHLKEREGTIVVKYLWSIENMHRFRVNWWGKDETGETILHGSVFVVMDSELEIIEELK